VEGKRKVFVGKTALIDGQIVELKSAEQIVVHECGF
jgi:hypothetical protein